MAYMKRALIIRLGAYGDIVHMSHLPRLLKEKGFDIVHVETNFKGSQLLKNNPYIDRIIYFPNEQLPKEAMRKDLVDKHFEILGEQYDKTANLMSSIEYAILMMETQNDYYKNTDFRRRRYANINYYDQMTSAAGFPEEVGKWTGELYFTDEEESIVKEYLDKYRGKFIVLLNVSGSSFHKRFIQIKEVAKKILDKYEDAIVITTGDASWKEHNCKEIDPVRVRTIIGTQTFSQASLLAKYVNCVIGCESGIMVVSNMWNTPTIQLMTCASLINHCKYAKNDYSMQSPAYCSPCCKGPYNYVGCPIKDRFPLCVWFDVGEIMKRVDIIYQKAKEREASLC